MEYRLIVDALLLIAVAANIAAAAFNLWQIRKERRRARAQRETLISALALRELFLSMCAQSWTVNAWPHIQMLALLHAWSAAAQNALQLIEAEREES